MTLNWLTLLRWTAGDGGNARAFGAKTPHYRPLQRGSDRNLGPARRDYSISLTDDIWRRPVREQLERFPTARRTTYSNKK